MKGRLIVITGMSGAGRSLAAKSLEDLGFFVVDNIPAEMVADIVDGAMSPARQRERVAVVVDARSGLGFNALRHEVAAIQDKGVEVTILFVDAEDGVLADRFEESRRPHPVAAPTLIESITGERAALAELREAADLIIDTTDTNVHELRTIIGETFERTGHGHPMRVSIQSFGFKHGVPRIVDLLFDVRFLPNPHWSDDLRPLTGLDEPVRRYVLDTEDAAVFLRMVEEMVAFLLPRYEAEGKSYLTLAIGCTGGRHRSVALAEEIGRWMREDGGTDVTVRHRDVDR